MKTLWFLFSFCLVLMFLSPTGFAQDASSSTSKKASYYFSSIGPAPAKGASPLSPSPKGYLSSANRANEPVQGRVVYANSITRMIYVADQDNVKRPVKLSYFQFSRVQLGQTVQVAGESISVLMRAPKRTGGLFVSRRFTGSRLLERWD